MTWKKNEARTNKDLFIYSSLLLFHAFIHTATLEEGAVGKGLLIKERILGFKWLGERPHLENGLIKGHVLWSQLLHMLLVSHHAMLPLDSTGDSNNSCGHSSPANKAVWNSFSRPLPCSHSHPLRAVTMPSPINTLDLLKHVWKSLISSNPPDAANLIQSWDVLPI